MKWTSHLKAALSKALGLAVREPQVESGRIPSGSPAQIIHSTFDQAFRLLSPKLIQLLVEESTSGRMFFWHSDLRKDAPLMVNSEEFDHSTADTYLQLMPGSDWILQAQDAREPLVVFDRERPKQILVTEVPEPLLKAFGSCTTVISVVIDLGDEWRGRFVICDPSMGQPARSTLDTLKKFSQTAARSIHAAHLCLRACRETAAEERARLARELHDGAIQSMLGLELQMESFKQRLGPMPEMQRTVAEMQGILRHGAAELRSLVNDSRRRALRPERLLEFLSDLLERFQRDTGVVTRFFADLDNDAMPPRICHELARLAEEGITNARKHSRASTLTVRLGSIGANWVLLMVDDGVGFDFQGTWPLARLVNAGFGPRVIKERVLALDGNLIIESTPTGARIEISIPKSSTVPITTLSKPRHDESYSSSNR